MRFRPRKFVVLLCLAKLCVVPCGFSSEEDRDNKKPYREEALVGDYNIAVVVVSTLRADHLGCYGYKKPTSPNIDTLATDGIVFDQAITQSNWTLPSIVSIFTSKYVLSHGVDIRNKAASHNELMMAEVLKKHGYKTGAFTGGLDLKDIYYLNQGFEVYIDTGGDKAMGGFREIIPRALEWLAENRNNKFFLFLHSYDVHQPYHAPEPYANMYDSTYRGIVGDLRLDYDFLKTIKRDGTFFHKKKGHIMRLTPRDIDYIIARYDAGVTYADSFIGELVEKLKEFNLLDKTIVILTADHGEELYDHGSFDRYGTNNVYDEVIRVPLIIRHPAIATKGRRIEHQVKLIDIMPTVLDFLGMPIHKDLQGQSLLGLIEERPPEGFNRYVFSQGRAGKQAIRTRGWKLICTNTTLQLYDLENDPGEHNDLSSKNPDKVYELYQKLLAWYRNICRHKSDYYQIGYSDEVIKGLREAGYW